MTSAEIYTGGATDCERPRRERRKGVLFCPDCGHESAIDGDWHVSRTKSGESVRCPVCDAELRDH